MQRSWRSDSRFATPGIARQSPRHTRDVSAVLILGRRAQPVDSLEGLVGPLEELVQAIEAMGGAAFRLYGLSPAHHLHEARGKVEAFVMTSEIEWNFGREPSDPTQEVILTNHPDRFGRSLFLSLQFYLVGQEAICPGISVEMAFGTDLAVDPWEALQVVSTPIDWDDLMVLVGSDAAEL